MNNLKQTVKKSFRMEMIGTGMYRALASQYKTRPDLQSRLREFAMKDNLDD